MPLNFVITREDMLRAKVVQPGWYICLVKNITQQQGKQNPQTTTTVIDFVIEDGPQKDAAGVPLRHYVGEAGAGFATNLIEALTGKKLTGDGANVDLTPAIGRKIQVYIKNDKFNDRLQNKAVDFMALGEKK